jgi:hypothetical protein
MPRDLNLAPAKGLDDLSHIDDERIEVYEQVNTPTSKVEFGRICSK